MDYFIGKEKIDLIMQESMVEETEKLIADLRDEIAGNNYIAPKEYTKTGVKRGLRNEDGSGVLAGLTRIASVQGYVMLDGERHPMPGRLIYRGINVEDLINGFINENRWGYEETVYLLLFGSLPTQEQLDKIHSVLNQ